MAEQLAEWITKQEALALTGWPERTLERYLQKKFIARDKRAEPGTRQETIVLLADVHKMLKTKEQEAERAKQPTVLKTTERTPTRDVTRHPAANEPPESVAEKIADALVKALSKLPQFQLPAPPKPPPTKLWLSLREAREYSGLPDDYLKEQCEAHSIDAFKRSVKGRWYIKRESLERHTAASNGNKENGGIQP